MRPQGRFFAVLGLSAMCTFAEPASAQMDAAATVRAREVAFAATMASRDFQAFLTFVSPEAVFFNGNRAIRGREAIRDEWERFFEGPTTPFSWAPDVVEVLESGLLALTSGPVQGPAGADAGRFNSVWRLDPDGVWRIIFDKGS